MFAKDFPVRPQMMGVVNTMLLEVCEIGNMVNPISCLTRLRHLQ